LGSASEAASFLFEECYRQGVLTSEYSFDNKRFLGKIAIKPDPEIRTAFSAADFRAQDLARLRLETDPDDVNALFAMTLSLGMQADYASLIEKHQMESLGMIREADKFAKKLLALNPDAADAYLTLGAANYIIDGLPALKRFFLHFKGISGDKRAGLQQLEIAATRGRYLRPFAKNPAGVGGATREEARRCPRSTDGARRGVPASPLFVSELAKLDASPDAAVAP
jgi:hypothetical protein